MEGIGDGEREGEHSLTGSHGDVLQTVREELPHLVVEIPLTLK